MRAFRVYVDTSVLGGCFDPEFSECSLSLIQDFRLGRLMPVLSEVIAAEVEPAPAAVRVLHEELLLLPAEVVPVTSEARSLVTGYEQRLAQCDPPRFLRAAVRCTVVRGGRQVSREPLDHTKRRGRAPAQANRTWCTSADLAQDARTRSDRRVHLDRSRA
jgi:hypothetical protein